MSILNATTTSGVVLTGDTTGNLTIQSAGNTVCTITATGANAGIQLASWAAPAFSAYIGTAQTISSNTYTKMQCNTKEFDTNNCYDSSTNYRFTPTVAGYYQVNGEYDLQTGTPTRMIITVYKNGSEFKRGNDIGLTSGNLGNGAGATVSALVYLNGSTDYIELYAYYSGGGTLTGGNATQSYFQAAMVRGA